MSTFHSIVSRRDFMKAIGLTGTGLGGAAALTAPVFHDLDEAISSEAPQKPWYVKERALENPTTEIDYTIIKPYVNGQTLNNATFAANYIPNYAATQANAGATKTAWLKAGNAGFRLQDWGLGTGASLPLLAQQPWSLWNAPANGTQTTITTLASNAVSITTPTSLGVPAYTGTPDDNARLLRSAMRYYGAPIVGFTALTTNTKKFLNTNYLWDPTATKGYTSAGTNYLPGAANLFVAEIGIPWGQHNNATFPSKIGGAGTTYGTSAQGWAASSAQRFLTAIGYQGMHGGLENCTQHGAFLALQGSGELARATNQIISWDFGICFSPTALTFDLPVTPTPPTDAGIQEFCRGCAKCADVCPSGALTHDDLSWVTPPWSVPGHKQFQNTTLNNCREYNTQIGTCSTCMGSCVFSKGNSSMIHQVIKATVATTSVFSPFFKKMDDLFGYGDTSFNQQNNPLTGHFNTKANDWWNLELPIHDIDKRQPTL